MPLSGIGAPSLYHDCPATNRNSHTSAKSTLADRTRAAYKLYGAPPANCTKTVVAPHKISAADV